MGLIKNKVRNWYVSFAEKLNKSKKSVVKKVSAGLTVGAIGVSALFGFVGCSNQAEKPPVVENFNEEIEILKEMVESLALLSSQLGSEDEAIKAQIEALTAKITELEQAKDATEDSLTAALTEIKELIMALQAEVDSIKDRLTALENAPEPEQPTITEEVVFEIEKN